MKEYTVIISRNGKDRAETGTLEELKQYFKYTLECGKSWENDAGCRKVNDNPKSGKALVNSLNNSAYNTQNYSTTYSLGA